MFASVRRSAAVWVGGQPWLPRFVPLIVWLDRTLKRVTRGRFTLLDLAALPGLTLIVRGRKTGIERETPLLYIPHPHGPLVAGSNWGAPSPPAWVANLNAAGVARVRIAGKVRQVRPHELHDAERDEMWQHMLETWPNFAVYQRRTSRQIKVFRLENV